MEDKVTLSNEELIERCDKWIVDLCKDRTNWTLSVPVQFNRDPDTLFTELIRRFKDALHPSESAGVKMPIFRVKANTGEIHSVKKYIIDTDGSESVWFDTWYGQHVIGQDCEWVGVKGAVDIWVKASEAPPKTSKVKWRRSEDKTHLDDLLVYEITNKGLLYNHLHIPFGHLEYLDETGATAQSGKEEAIDPMDFHKWMNERGWTFHRDEKIWYRSDDRHQWPPDEVIETTSHLYDIYKQSK